MQKGKIGVTTENIFPVIKKFLYSDHEIFLRELVSNAIDATQKLKTLASCGEYKGELGETPVRVSLDKEAGTLTVSDSGIGMTSEEIDKFINQIAFSGAEEFLEKYKENASAIIGHFGLGFYSAFMVSKKVEIRSLSYREGAEGVKWECDGSPEYSMEPFDKASRGTDIVLHLDDDSKDFLEKSKIESLLKKYCRFLPVPVIFGREQQWKDGKYVDTDKDKVINDTAPVWMKKPSELKEEDYHAFYRELYPGQDDPLFWIHLNVDYPFTLTGVLFFPKIKNNFDLTKNRIQLYCNQVFVTDSVEGVVPEFMMLLQGVIDSPDIPLNVSRSYLQSDAAVKKISTYITKKVSSRLEEIFKADRKEFEKKWEDIKIFIQYGMLTDEKFREQAMKFTLVEDTGKNHYTLEEYRELISSTQTDKDGSLVHLYATDPVAQYQYINMAAGKGYSVLLMEGQLDSHFVGLLEQQLEKSRFVRVDSDVTDNLISRQDKKEADLTAAQRQILTEVFSSQMPTMEKANFLVSIESMSSQDTPTVITQNEYMRRMKEMAALQGGMGFYEDLPDSYNLIVNLSHPLVAKVKEEALAALTGEVSPISEAIEQADAEIKAIREGAKEGKPSEEESKQIAELEEEISKNREKQTQIVSAYASGQDLVKQLIDLALLGNGLLKGEALSAFIKRSASLLK